MAVNSTRRATILAEIDNLNEDIHNAKATEDRIYHLRHEYNQLIDEEVISSPLGDPLEILPPELWMNILPANVDDLLVLTMVSSRWCHKLLSTAVLWSKVLLDQQEPDYLAKAMTLIHLSRPVELEVRVDLPLEVWRKVAPMIVTESTRICRLSAPSRDRLSPEEYLSILSDFGNLPALKYLMFPFANSFRGYGYRGLVSIGDYYYPPHKFPFHHMPNLRNATDVLFTAELLKNGGLSELENVEVRNLNAEMTATLSNLPNLAHIRFDEESSNREDSLLESAERTKGNRRNLAPMSLDYWGNFVVRTVRCIGDNLVQLSTTVNLYDMEALLYTLCNFSTLKTLVSTVLPEKTQRTVFQIEAMTLKSTSIRFVDFYFVRTPLISDEYGTKDDEIFQKANSDNQIYHSIFLALTRTVPLADMVHLGGQFIAEPALEYVLSLQRLKTLHFMPKLPIILEVGVPITPHLLRAACFPFLIPVNIFNQVSFKQLDFLEISNEIEENYWGYYSEDVLHELQDLICYPSPPKQIQTLRELRIQMVRPAPFNPDNFSILRSISFRAWAQQDIWASDLLEEIILRPDILPSLEHIGLYGIFIEWDILILMLERRNLVAQPGTSRIKTLIFEYPLPYKLLYPITQLLKGKFAERSSLEEFSITVVGDRLFNPQFPGCRQCICSFRPCDASTLFTDDEERRIFKIHDYFLGWKYLPPSERIVPNPPLSTHLMQWVKEKRTRRKKYVELFRSSAPSMSRETNCPAPLFGSNVVGSYSLDGANFA